MIFLGYFLVDIVSTSETNSISDKLVDSDEFVKSINTVVLGNVLLTYGAHCIKIWLNQFSIFIFSPFTTC